MWKWKFFQYVSPSGRQAISDWRRTLPVGPNRADMDTFLNLMARTSSWTYPQLKPLRGMRYKGLSELRWTSGKVEHRLVGYIAGRYLYVLLIGCTHKQQRYDPAEALDTAARRKNQIDKQETVICEYPLIALE